MCVLCWERDPGPGKARGEPESRLCAWSSSGQPEPALPPQVSLPRSCSPEAYSLLCPQKLRCTCRP